MGGAPIRCPRSHQMSFSQPRLITPRNSQSPSSLRASDHQSSRSGSPYDSPRYRSTSLSSPRHRNNSHSPRPHSPRPALSELYCVTDYSGMKLELTPDDGLVQLTSGRRIIVNITSVEDSSVYPYDEFHKGLVECKDDSLQLSYGHLMFYQISRWYDTLRLIVIEDRNTGLLRIVMYSHTDYVPKDGTDSLLLGLRWINNCADLIPSRIIDKINNGEVTYGLPLT